jgi:hypothetical protein
MADRLLPAYSRQIRRDTEGLKGRFSARLEQRFSSSLELVVDGKEFSLQAGGRRPP